MVDGWRANPRAARRLSCSVSSRSSHCCWSDPVRCGSASSANAAKCTRCRSRHCSPTPLSSSRSRANWRTVSSKRYLPDSWSYTTTERETSESSRSATSTSAMMTVRRRRALLFGTVSGGNSGAEEITHGPSGPGTGDSEASSHSPQCLHFLATTFIVSPHTGQARSSGFNAFPPAQNQAPLQRHRAALLPGGVEGGVIAGRGTGGGHLLSISVGSVGEQID